MGTVDPEGERVENPSATIERGEGNTSTPDTYFKYLAPERVDVLQNLKIRFTQVSALNDPFEDYPGIMLGERSWYLDQFRRRFDAWLDEQGIMERAQRRKLWRDAVKTRFTKFYECYTDVSWLLDLSETVQHMSDSVSGCLSLSATPTNILMWSHYARHHTGFVVGFHAAHEFFGPTVSPVIYSSDRPKVNPFEARHEGALAYTKSEHWKYEQEYRKFKCFVEPVRLSNGNWLAPYQKSSSKRETNNSVVLFPFPADSIAKVILGWKSTPELHSTVVASLETHNLGHIPVLFARPSPTLYEMELAPQRPEPFHWPPQ